VSVVGGDDDLGCGPASLRRSRPDDRHEQHAGRPGRPGAAGTGGTVIVTGGVRIPSDALVGPVAVAALRQLHLDMLILGVHGMTQRAGFSTPTMLEADVNRAFVEASHRLVVVADHTKWGNVGLSTIARLDQADVLVSDAGLDRAARRLLGEAPP
jgi:DeoR/GlpR family transcriptional regulator of sugar metabolism